MSIPLPLGLIPPSHTLEEPSARRHLSSQPVARSNCGAGKERTAVQAKRPRPCGATLCDAALLALALAMYLLLGLPTSGSLSSILSDLILIAPLWNILLFGTGALIIAGSSAACLQRGAPL